MKKMLISSVLLMSAFIGSTSYAQEKTLKIAFADPVSSMDPQLNNWAGDRSVAFHFWDLLIENRDNKLIPGLASSWKPLDKLTWEFKLRPDIKWQDGVPVTADDIIFSFQRAGHVPGSVATYAGYFRTIDTMTAQDPHTLIIKTKIPNPNLPLNLSSVLIVSKHIGEKSTTEDYNSGKAMVGSGPYKFVSYVPGDRVIMEKNNDFIPRNNNYWDGKPEWDKVIYRYINNGSARTAALLSGDVDVIDKVSPSDISRLKSDPKVSVYAYDGLRVLILQPSFRAGPNQYITDNSGKILDKNPLTDVRVREALSLAIDRKAIVDRIMQHTASIANQWMPKNTFGYNANIKNIAYDPTQAKKLLAEAGYPDGFKITISVPNDRYPLAPETIQAIAQFWTRIGVKTQVEVLPWAAYSTKANKNEFAVSVIAWGNGTGEASYAMTNILATVNPQLGMGASNWGHYSNPKLDQDLIAATEEFDDKKRESILQSAAEVVSDDVGIIPLFHYQNIWAVKKGLEVKPIFSDRTTATMVKEVK